MATILVIEDEKDYLENICFILEREGYETIKAENGEIGVEMARTHQPDLILCDIVMPKKSGFDVIEELKKDSRTSEIPIIFLTVWEQEEYVKEGQKLGATDYILKSSDNKKVLFSIQTHLELIGLVQTLEKMKSDLNDKVDKLNTGIQKFEKEPNQEILIYRRQLEEKNDEIKFLREMISTILLNIENRKFEIKNENILYVEGHTIKNIINSSSVIEANLTNGLNQVKDKYGDEIASELERVLDIIKNSGNEAVESLKKFIEELNREKSQKGKLKDYLDKICSLVPLVDNISKIVDLISKIIP
ncbi:MAG: response regulator [Candidatus Aminicenantes bacterium]|nr:MAG: response regulator [Candidatus Aminicenantes bacterium]